MTARETTQKNTARETIERWVAQLDELFRSLSEKATAHGWSAVTESTDIKEDPFGLGAPFQYVAPVLVLKRPAPGSDHEQRITFEPRHRYTMGAAGRIDVYAYPSLREALLLRIPDTSGAADLTREEAEERVSRAPWKAFSPERLPLDADLADTGRFLRFLDDLVGPS
jgi:hypothetical protein